MSFLCCGAHTKQSLYIIHFIELNQLSLSNLDKPSFTFLGYIMCNQKINPKQHGIRSGRGCFSQLLEHHIKILEELENSNNVSIIYFDFGRKKFEKSTTASY